MVDSFFNALPEYLELLMGYVPVLLMIAVPIAFLLARRKTKNETNLARNTAGLLGLNYINVAEEMKSSKPKDSLLLGLLSGWSPWAMDGTYNSVPVRVELIVKGRQQRYIAQSDRVSDSNPTRTSYSRGTKYVTSFNKPLPFEVGIRKKIKMPFGFSMVLEKDTINTDDEELDQMLYISGNDKDKIKNWLSSDKRKDSLKKIFQSLPSVNVTSEGLLLYDLYSKADYDRVHNNLELLSEASLKLKMD